MSGQIREDRRMGEFTYEPHAFDGSQPLTEEQFFAAASAALRYADDGTPRLTGWIEGGDTNGERWAVELWASGDITHELAVSRETLRRWRAFPDFPAPRWQVSRGKLEVWDAAEVRAWHQQARAEGRVR